MGQLQEKLDDFDQLGYSVYAVCPDRPELIASAPAYKKLAMPILSDSSMAASRAFGLSFRLDDTTAKRYAQYGIDLEKASGYPHHQLPIPAVYIVEKGGTVAFQYTNPQYTVRPSADFVLLAAKECSQRRKQ